VARPGAAAGLLLIEDDAGDALFVRECLAEAGVDTADIIGATTLAEGIAVLATGPFCVLLDLGLPDASGLSALVDLVEAAPDVPVIVLTGRHDQTGTDALAAGAQDYLVKDDISANLLDRSIRYAVERKRAQRTSLQLREAQFTAAEKSRLERGLLPTPLLHSAAVECSTYYQPGRDHAILGGDFYDVVETADGSIRAVIGDVMGHGPDEAAIGVHLRVAWRTLVLAGTPDAQILPTLATLFAAESGGPAGFATACDITLAPDRKATVRVAGHPAPLLCAAGRTSYLDVAVGPPIGVELPPTLRERWAASGGWPQSTLPIDEAASLILYTDGLLDAYAPAGGGLGIDELVRAVDVCAARGGAVSSWIPTLVDGAPNRSMDDTAVVVITARPLTRP
jgi:serine phosphatase RsbU (regulator of sigma subunit)